MMELALEVRLGARHVHARVAQRRREGRHLREVAVGQVGVVLCEAAGGGACRLRPVDGRYVLAKQQLWLAVVPASSRVPRARHAPASSGAFKQGLFGSRHFVTPVAAPRAFPPPDLVLPPPRPPPLSPRLLSLIILSRSAEPKLTCVRRSPRDSHWRQTWARHAAPRRARAPSASRGLRRRHAA